ncbi:hypothetical protein PFICI_02535 [Pestalotiopsis fici W106-1]|uniref:Cytochrome P450 n=1 Tax=Pestalotiopsis fici (strain W106-1 / CGMCC3.15140) TaxID=1229662 RepID=W3XEN3_PESFW|nr:uncharacterized protein PFICI_02535 [Pestalotiopsis fici W106-1]ETS84510.1 hypothetical protein PFICI_02535 [Pestalotiopsis fici W106-1]
MLHSFGEGIRIQIIYLSAASLLIYRIALIFYRLWFHPLRKVPGPWLNAASSLPFRYQHHIQATWTRQTRDMHMRYGSVVRIAPDVLAVEGSVAWPQIYHHRSGGNPEFLKGKNFFFPGDKITIIGGNTTEVHRRQRRHLAHAFSEAAIYKQEPIIKSYIDLFISRLRERAVVGETFNLVHWLNFTTFDIIGDLAFANSFGSLESSNYHPWVLAIFENVKAASYQGFLRAYPILSLLNYFRPAKSLQKELQNREYAAAKAQARISQGAEPQGGRRDFMTYMLRENRHGEKGISDVEIMANSGVLVGAGSETTATALSGFFFYAAQNPAILDSLKEEVRSAFSDESEISMRSTEKLVYLKACIEETLRVYPPAPEIPARISLSDYINRHYIPAGVNN